MFAFIKTKHKMFTFMDTGSKMFTFIYIFNIFGFLDFY